MPPYRRYRILEYEGDPHWVDLTIEQSLTGRVEVTPNSGNCITARTLRHPKEIVNAKRMLGSMRGLPGTWLTKGVKGKAPEPRLIITPEEAARDPLVQQEIAVQQELKGGQKNPWRNPRR